MKSGVRQEEEKEGRAEEVKIYNEEGLLPEEPSYRSGRIPELQRLFPRPSNPGVSPREKSHGGLRKEYLEGQRQNKKEDLAAGGSAPSCLVCAAVTLGFVTRETAGCQERRPEGLYCGLIG